MAAVLRHPIGMGAPDSRIRSGASGYAPGLLIACAIGLVAFGAGKLVPVVGGPPIAIILGAVLSPAVRRRVAYAPGVALAGGFVLQCAVIVLGAQLSLHEVAAVGAASLPVMLGTLAICLAVAAVAGRRMGVGRDLRTLIGVGTAICGASAIAAVSPVIRARSADVAYAISTIFLFNVAAVIAFPPVGHLLGLGQQDFGLFAGTAVNDTSSVVAAASTYGGAAADHAVVVKLTRSLMIIPICLGLAVLARRWARGGDDPRAAAPRASRLVPWFIVGFVAVATANSLGWIPGSARAGLAQAALVLISVALAGIGLSTDLAGLRRAGHRPLLLGLFLWVVVASSSLGLQALIH